MLGRANLHTPRASFIWKSELLSRMGLGRNLFLVALAAVFLSVGLNYILAPALTAPGSDGSLNQSPVIYIVLLIGVFVIGFLALNYVKKNNSDAQFDFWIFVCVALSGVLIGGVIHEFTHIALLQHPTQFRVHFGDSSAIFSTCCLGFGEYAHEEIAYAIQFFVSLGWILAFRNKFYIRGKQPSPKKVKKRESKEKESNDDNNGFEGHVDKEWEAARRSIDELREGKKPNEDKKTQKKRDALTREWENLDKLKVPRRE
jgi:hypothetical protein